MDTNEISPDTFLHKIYTYTLQDALNEAQVHYLEKTYPPMFASTRPRNFHDVIILWRHTVLITADYSDQTNFSLSLNN